MKLLTKLKCLLGWQNIKIHDHDLYMIGRETFYKKDCITGYEERKVSAYWKCQKCDYEKKVGEK